MPDYSIIIPHRGDPIGLWATVCACETQLANSDYSYEYCLLSNGDEQESDQLKYLVDYLEKRNKLGFYKFLVEAKSPPNARALCVDNSRGEYLAFFDNHCIPDVGYFDIAEKCLVDDECDILHSTTIFYPGQDPHVQYRLKLKYNFWGEASALPYMPHKKYKIAAAGHGGFFVKRNVWYDLGGYGPANLLEGYGGEELIFDLKAWRLGKKVWLHPKLKHYHYAGKRGYSRHFTQDYYRNLLVSALVIGGEKWFNDLYLEFSKPTHLKTFNHIGNMFDIYMDAYNRGIEYSKLLDSKSKYNLDELVTEVFRMNEVQY